MPTKEIAPGVLAVTELPKDIVDVEITFAKDKIVCWSSDVGAYEYKLPPGQWSIVGWSDELPEEQCKDVVGNKVFLTSTESFQSLLRSHGITDRALIIKKEK